MGAEPRDVLQELRQRFRPGAEWRPRAGPDADETCRHIDLIADGLHREIGRVAEGIIDLAERLDRMETDTREQIRRSIREFDELARALVNGDGS